MFTNILTHAGHTDRCTHEGFDLILDVNPDPDATPPWENEEGHGPVSEWTGRAKAPGEMVLNQDHNLRRFYDFKDAVALARKEGWDCEPFGQGTPGQRAHRSAMADFERLRAWCNDEWFYVGITITAERKGVTLGRASLWGIESDCGGYAADVVADLVKEAIADAEKTLTQLIAA